MQVLEDIGLHVKKPMILWVDCKDALDLTYGWNISRLMKHASVHACFLHELKEANLLLCIWLHTETNMEDMYTKLMSPDLYNHHQHTIMCDDNDNNKEYHQYLHKILDTFHITITNSPGEGVGSGQAEPAVGVGSQVLPIPAGEYGEYSGESGGLLDGGTIDAKN